MTKKPRRPRKVVRLVKTLYNPLRYDFDEGFAIIANPDGSWPDQETALMLLEKSRIKLMSDEIGEAVEDES
jgi:hypothetical protein